MKTVLAAVLVFAALLFPGCATKKQKFNAPDPAKVIAATQKMKASQKAARESHKKELENVKAAQGNADALSLQSFGAIQKLDELAKVAPPEFQPAIVAIHLDVEKMQEIELLLNNNLGAAWTNGDATERHLIATDAGVVKVEEAHKDYYADAQKLADKTTAINDKLVETETTLHWYRWHFWMSWIVLGGGVALTAVIIWLWKSGKLAARAAAVAAKIAI